jgi:hypothetical protein
LEAGVTWTVFIDAGGGDLKTSFNCIPDDDDSLWTTTPIVFFFLLVCFSSSCIPTIDGSGSIITYGLMAIIFLNFSQNADGGLVWYKNGSAAVCRCWVAGFLASLETWRRIRAARMVLSR